MAENSSFNGDLEKIYWEEHIRPILGFLSWLKVQAECRYADWPDRPINYEDLAYLAGQIADDLLDNYENPALTQFVKKAVDELERLLTKSESLVTANLSARSRLQEIAGNTVDYIRYATALLLGHKPAKEDCAYMQLFADAALDSRVSELHYFTLNHDTLMESCMAARHIQMADGFTNGNDMRRWDASTYDSENRIRLYKLHGSANWQRYRPKQPRNPNNPWDGEVIGIGSDPTFEPMYEPPLILTGTFNKLFGYTEGLFLELHHRFLRQLQKCDHLVVCGYGFGDKGINQRIVERMTSEPLCKMLVIDPSTSFTNARGAIAGKTEAWRNDGRFLHWRHGLEKGDAVSWNRIATEFLKLV